MLLLPTGYYLLGGMAAVAISFAALAFLSPKRLSGYRSYFSLWSPPQRGRFAISAVSFLCLLILVAAGFLGSRNPLANPLPLFVWTLFWVGLTLVQGVIGDVWRWLDPWYAPCRLLRGDAPPLFKLPASVAMWPAVLLFLGFAWFELIDLAPEDPARLAIAVSVYWLATFACMLAFGRRQWGRSGEFLTIFFSALARFSIVSTVEADDGSRRLCLRWPGSGLIAAQPFPPSGVIFLLAVLGSVSFDGLSRTFFWLGGIGVNPLEFPGRSAVVAANSFGLAATIAVLAAAFYLAVTIGLRLAGKGEVRHVAGLLVWSIVPIALAYHFSHYLTALLVDGQYGLAALSDPFGKGWNLFGTAHMQIHAGITAGHDAAWLIWNAQALAIIAGHILAVLAAHMLALRLFPNPETAVRSQLALAVLMIAYTVFGLWLLSTPSVG